MSGDGTKVQIMLVGWFTNECTHSTAYCWYAQVKHKQIVENTTYLRSPPIEVRIKLMNNRTEFLDGLKTDFVCILDEERNSIKDGTDPDEVDQVVGR